VGSIIDAMVARQQQRGFLGDADLRELASSLSVPLYRLQGLASFYPHFRREPPKAAVVAVCRDVACRLKGGVDGIARVRDALGDLPDVEIEEVSCLGRCEMAPAAAVNEHPVCARPVDELRALAQKPPSGPPGEAAPTTPGKRWESDPYEAESDRYGALRQLAERGFDGVAATITESGLRGMGGAAFPTGRKWQMVAGQVSTPKYVVCNADESEPGTFKDRVILEQLPHLVLEGMAVAAGVIGASEGIVFIRHEYVAERHALERAIVDARERGMLGADALGGGRPFDVRVAVSPGGYILGEETALLECLEDRRGEPRHKPPFPGEVGLYGKPTLINNVETFSHVPAILRWGADAWKARGKNGSTGLKFIALSGDVVRPGVYLVPMGSTIRELLSEAGGVSEGREVLAIAPGGASSNFLDASGLDAALDFEALAKRGSMLGSGAVFIVAQGADLLDLVTNIVTFFRNESCGKCVPCRVGSEKAVAMLERGGSKRHLEVLSQLEETMAQTSICGLGQVALAPLRSVLEKFEEEVQKRFPED